MKGSLGGLVILAGIACLILAAPHASATTTCHATGSWCQGFAHVSASGISGTLCGSLRTTNTAPTCNTGGITPGNEASWQMDASACLTFYYFQTTTGLSPPATPNKVTISIAFDTSGTSIRTYKDGTVAPDASGTSYSFCATSDGTSGGAARAGTYRIFLRLIKDNGAGGVGNYNCSSDGSCSVGTFVSSDKGALRGNTKVASVARSAYPAGSTFAFATTGNEQVTVTSTFTQPNGDLNIETMNDGVLDAATMTVGSGGSATDVDATTLAQAITIDQSGTPSTGSPYVAYVSIDGLAGLTGLSWTTMATTGHGANIVAFSATVAYDSTTFNINPDVKFDSDGVGSYATADDVAVVKLTSSSGAATSLFNKGETFYSEFYLFNARGEKMTRTMTIAREDATPTSCGSGSFTPTAGLYSFTGTLATGGSCTTTNDATGAPRYFRATTTNQNHRSAQVFAVSSLYYLDAHIEKSSTLVKDDYPTENSAEDTAYIISTAVTDTTHLWCHVKSVRKDLDIDTSGSVIAWSYIDGTSTTRFTGTTDTASDGWTPTHLDLLASTPLTPPDWTTRCAISSGATFNGNYGTNDQTFTVTIPAAATIFPGDPLRGSCTPGVGYAGDVMACTVSASNLDGSARTSAAASILYDLYGPSGTAVTTGGAVVEQGTTGVYSMTYTLGSSPATGNWKLVFRTTDAAPVTTHALFTVRVDPTVALANSLATVISNQATAATQVSSVSTQVAGVATQVSGVQSTATEIDTDADEVLAGQAGAATQVSGVATQVSGVQSTATEIAGDTDTLLANQAAQAAAVLAEIEATETTTDDLINATAGEVLDAIQHLNVTVTGNLTIDNSTLQSILHEVQDHREHSLEMDMNNDFAGLGLDGYLFALFWFAALIFFLARAKALTAISCTIGIFVTVLLGGFGDWTQGAALFLLAFTIWIEAIGRDRLYQRMFPKSTTAPEPQLETKP